MSSATRDPRRIAASRAYAGPGGAPMRPSQRLARGASEPLDLLEAELEVGPYAGIVDATVILPGRDFTPSQKRKIIAANRGRNGGQLRSDDPADPYQVLSAPAKSVSRGMGGSGQDPAMAAVDHIEPRARGGTNAYANARVISQSYNNLLRTKGL